MRAARSPRNGNIGSIRIIYFRVILSLPLQCVCKHQNINTHRYIYPTVGYLDARIATMNMLLSSLASRRHRRLQLAPPRPPRTLRSPRRDASACISIPSHHDEIFKILSSIHALKGWFSGKFTDGGSVFHTENPANPSNSSTIIETLDIF